MKILRALSVRQPYAEQILRGTKKKEFRSVPTHIRERVYIYASKKPGPLQLFQDLRCEPGDLPTGVIVGTVEIVGCSGSDGDYAYHLARPKRLARPLHPPRPPQPIWFRPFD
jgi:ASCH domain-containing protein